MSSTTGTVSYDVRIWKLSSYKGKRGTTYTVRWLVADNKMQKTFATKKLGESYRAELLTAARNGVPFEVLSGLPVTMARAVRRRSWLDHACAFVDSKWARASARHRRNIAEALASVTLAVLPGSRSDGELATARLALRTWAFNRAARGGKTLLDAEPPARFEAVMRWLADSSPDLLEFKDAELLRTALDSLAVKLDGKLAAPATVTRKKSALYSALDYAVELDYFEANPIDKVKWTQPEQTDAVDRRVVANPSQARALIAAVGEIYPSLEAFFACLYFAALRPSEAARLDVDACVLPETGWGTLLLPGSTGDPGRAWTDSGEAHEDRGLKHRAEADTRPVPACPELVVILRRHIDRFGAGPGGRLFVTRVGRFGRPLPAAYSNPVSSNTYARVWQKARARALSEAQQASKLAARPYDLRHAGVSLQLNAGVPPQQVAEWAGHSLNVLLRVYAKCLDGHDEVARRRIEAALRDNHNEAERVRETEGD